MGFTAVFGAQPQNPAQVSYSTVALTADTQFYWPWNNQGSTNVAAKISNVTASVGPLKYIMPPANQASPGEAVLFFNIGSNSFNVQDANGGNIASITAGTAKFIYLIDNTTIGGSWTVFTFGTGSSSSDASALAGAGLLAISGTLNEALSVTDFSSSGFNLTSSSRALMYNWTGGSGTVTTDNPSSLGTSWFSMLRNSGSGTLALTPATGTVDGASSKNFNPGDAAFVIQDGSNLVTLGFGQSALFSFDHVAINAAGTGNLTLSAPQQNRISYTFTGLLTGDRTIIVPTTVQQYWITNSTTGAFHLYVRTAGQTPPGVEIIQGQANILYCDGTNVVSAVSGSGISTPVSIVNGGTGATSAGAALTNLGGTTVGQALFMAASASAAAAAINAAVVNANNNFSTDQTLVSTDGGSASAPNVITFRNSASPAASDFIGSFQWQGKDSGGNTTLYADMTGIIIDPTNGSEDASIAFSAMLAGSYVRALTLLPGLATMVSFDNGASLGPILELFRDSASPAASDSLGQLTFTGRNSVSNKVTYGTIWASIVDPVTTTEDGKILIQTLQAGTLTTTFQFSQGLFANTATGGDKGLGTVNATGYFLNGTALSAPTFYSGTYKLNADITSVIPLTDSVPLVSAGVSIISTGLASVVVPATTSTVYGRVTGICSSSQANTPIITVFRGSVNVGVGVGMEIPGIGSGQSIYTFAFDFVDVSGSAATFAYTVRAGSDAGTIRFNGSASSRYFGGTAAVTCILTVTP